MAEIESDDEKITVNRFLPLRTYDQMMTGVVYIKYLGTGFLIYMYCPCLEKWKLGILTCDHVLPENKLYDRTIEMVFEKTTKNEALSHKTFIEMFFTASEIDTTFLVLEDDAIKFVLDRKCHIFQFHVHSEKILNDKGHEVKILQYPEGKMDAAEGKIVFTSGLRDFLFAHDVSTLRGSSGSPVLDIKTSKVVGIHKRKVESNINGGIRLVRVLEAMKDTKYWKRCHFEIQLKCIGENPNFMGEANQADKPVKLVIKSGSASIEELLEMGKRIECWRNLATELNLILDPLDPPAKIDIDAIERNDEKKTKAFLVLDRWSILSKSRSATYAVLHDVLLKCGLGHVGEQYCME